MNLQDEVGDSYLELQIDSKTMALLAMASIQEVINIPVANIVPVPNMKVGILGLLNHRSQVYWVIDLGQFLGLPFLDVSLSKYAVVILSTQQSVLAIAIPMIKGMQKLTSDRIQKNILDIPIGFQPYIEGCLAQADSLIPVLSPEALVRIS